jgi:Cys-rich repeat protein
MPGGRCEPAIYSGQCAYDDCREHAECAPGQRCVCDGYALRCLEAECLSDDECGAGERCRANRHCDQLLGYHCSGAQDECDAQADCRDPNSAECGFSDGRFICSDWCIEL